jgi:hypothetical protein
MSKPTEEELAAEDAKWDAITEANSEALDRLMEQIQADILAGRVCSCPWDVENRRECMARQQELEKDSFSLEYWDAELWAQACDPYRICHCWCHEHLPAFSNAL